MNKKEIKVEVKQKYIDSGVKGNERLCPVARALMEITDRKNIQVCSDAIVIGRKFYNLPKSVKQFIYRFDNYGHDSVGVEPFNFILRELTKEEIENL